jgi:hydrogenase maturation protease
MSTLVIGYGNTLRQDDGAGVALAERLVAHWQGQQIPATLVTVPQLVPELAAEIAAAGVTRVVFVDAAVGAPQAGVQIRLLGHNELSPSLGHHLDPAVLMAYTRLLYGRTVPAWLVTVPGVAFEYGEGLSAHVQAALATAPVLVDRILSE